MKHKGTHLTYEDRLIIERLIFRGNSKTYIARLLSRSFSTISYEISSHRFKSFIGDENLLCKHLVSCRPGECRRGHRFERAVGTRRDRSPCACNGCLTFRSCKLDRYRYEAKRNQSEYELTLSDSRTGVNLTSLDARKPSNIIKPLLERGMAPYIIIRKNKNLGITEKTLYTYIEDGILGKSRYRKSGFTEKSEI